MKPAVVAILLAGCTEVVRVDFPFPPRTSDDPATELLAITIDGVTSVYATNVGEPIDLPLERAASEPVELQAVVYAGSLADNGFERGLQQARAGTDFTIDFEAAFAARIADLEATAWSPIAVADLRPELRAQLVPARRAIRLASGLGSRHTCAIYDDDGARCWGRNTHGQLDTPEALLLEPPAEPFARDIRAITTGGEHTCVLSESGRVACIGRNDFRQLGSVSGGLLIDPIEVPGLSDIVEIDSGFHLTCARDRRGAVTCWGRTNPYDRRGDGNHQPFEVTLGMPVQDLATSTFSVCGVAGGHVLCEGVQVCGLLPTATVAEDRWDHIDLTFPSPAIHVELGDTFGCALLESQELSCWGCNGAGQLVQDPPFRALIQPDHPIIGGVRAIELGSDSSCVILQSGGVECRGDDRKGQVGDGADFGEMLPLSPVAGLTGVTQVEVYNQFACALDEAGDIHCWGLGEDGQLGNGGDVNRAAPVRVTRVRAHQGSGR